MVATSVQTDDPLVSREQPTAVVRSRTPWLYATIITLTSRAVFIATAYAASWLLASSNGRSKDGPLAIWAKWDAGFYLGIAKNGYASRLTEAHSSAFFPLYPMLIRGVSATGISLLHAAMLINAIASIVAFAFLFRLAELIEWGSGRRAVLYLALFPTSVFLIAPYSEVLFLAGAIAAFYYAKSRHWHLVGFPAAIAMGTRLAAIFLLLGLIVEFVAQREFYLDKIAIFVTNIALSTTPLVAYAVYLAKVKGNALLFLSDQRLGWGRTYVGPVKSFLATWRTWNNSTYPTNWIFAWRLEIVATAVGLFFTVWALKRREWGYAAFMGTTMAALTTSSWYYSIPRLLLSLFPIVLLLAAFTRKSSTRHEFALLILIPFATLGVIVFTKGAWFF
jgi:hypothetical protein